MEDDECRSDKAGASDADTDSGADGSARTAPDGSDVCADETARIESAQKDDAEKRPRKPKPWSKLWWSGPRAAVAAVAIVVVIGVAIVQFANAQGVLEAPKHEIGKIVSAGSGGDQGSAPAPSEDQQRPGAQTDQQQQEQQQDQQQQAAPQQDQGQAPSSSQDDHAGPSGGASSGGSGGGSAPAPAHVHTWVPITEQRWIVDRAAWDERKCVGSYIQCSCGATFNTMAEWTAHVKAAGIDSPTVHNYHLVEKYANVHHDATGHYETVTVGYRCSGCGATK